VHVSAAVKVNGKEIGLRLARPFRFDITRAVKPGANTIEVEVANTVANHFRSEAPTRYVYPGQDQSGLVAPVLVEIFR
jgi:predicted choloylglycine hydrolase